MTILKLIEELQNKLNTDEKLLKELKRVSRLMKLIESKGYQVYIVGGYVRDRLLGIESTDIDITTNMPISIAQKLFSDLGMNVQLASGDKETKVLIVNGIELAQFRKDVYDENNQFVEAIPGTLKEDAERRDATINSLYEDSEGNVIDVMNGLKDMHNKLIRACGNPVNRMDEDKSRILRYAYLAAKLGFELDDTIIQATKTHKHWIKEIHPNLKGKIILKAIKSGAFYDFIENLEKMDIVFDLFPEFKNLKGLQQNEKYHHLDGWNHVKAVLKHAELIRPKDEKFILSALYHDVGKGLDMYIGSTTQGKHEVNGVEIAKESIINFGFGKEFADYVSFITELHGNLPLEKEVSVKRWAKKAVKYTSSKQELLFYLEHLLDFSLCDAYGFNDETRQEMLPKIEVIRSMIQPIIEKYPFFIKDLPINGKDIMTYSSLKGKEIGEFLKKALELEITDKEKLIKLLKK